MKVAIWGVGKKMLWTELHLRENVDIECIIDSNPEKVGQRIIILDKDYSIISPLEIDKYRFDVLIVAVENEKYCREIELSLKDMGIEKSKILFVSRLSEYDSNQIGSVLKADAIDEREKGYMYIGKKRIECGFDHPLYETKNRNLMYNSFLPILASYGLPGQFAIDVGANIGDTCIDIAENSQLKVVCVEPSKVFFKMLLDNTKYLNKENRVIYVKAFATNTTDKHICDVGNGTSVMRLADSEEESINKSLDEIVSDIEMDYKDLYLVKSDTDGFDWRVLLSGESVFKNSNAVLFWENQIDSIEQFKGYLKAIDFLRECEYTMFYIFDNRGNYLCQGDSNTATGICDYLQRINVGWSTRTFEYVDILACKDSEIEICSKALERFLSVFKTERLFED